MHSVMRQVDWKHWWTWYLGLFDVFQEYVLGYGRYPTPPLVWSFIFVAIGFFVFRNPTSMQPRVDKPADFSAGWYSLELFLPIVDLGVAKEWRPKSTPRWRVAYAHAHQLARWILIPVALAAITGVIK